MTTSTEDWKQRALDALAVYEEKTHLLNEAYPSDAAYAVAKAAYIKAREKLVARLTTPIIVGYAPHGFESDELAAHRKTVGEQHREIERLNAEVARLKVESARYQKQLARGGEAP